MNLINKILILIIILVVINHLSEGKILNIFQNFTNMCKEQFMGITYTNNKGVYYNHIPTPYQRQLDFPYLNHNDINNLDDETYHLYKFINDKVTPNVNNYELTKSNDIRIPVNKELENEIRENIIRIFNSQGYKFNNIQILDKLHYYDNPRGKEIEPFNFEAIVTYKGKPLGSMTINIESFIREDKLYKKPMKSGYFTITNIRLMDRKYPDGKSREKVWNSRYRINSRKTNPTKEEFRAIKENNKMINKMTESFNNHFVNREDFDDLFIKPNNSFKTEGFMNDTDNSLIPSIVELSSYEQSSYTESS